MNLIKHLVTGKDRPAEMASAHPRLLLVQTRTEQTPLRRLGQSRVHDVCKGASQLHRHLRNSVLLMKLVSGIAYLNFLCICVVENSFCVVFKAMNLIRTQFNFQTSLG